MKIVKLSKSQIKAVEKWLETMQDTSITRCPFHDKTYWFCKRICWKLFPRIGHGQWCNCPCSDYSYSYVRRVAINLLKQV